MSRLLILLMAVLLFLEPLEARGLIAKHYSLAGPIQFADADQIPGSPLLKKSSLPTEKEIATLGFIPLPVRAIFTPTGFFSSGAGKIIDQTVMLIRKTENLNKMIKGISPHKTALLLPYLGLEGLDLLSSFLQGKQRVRPEGGRVVNVRLFSSEGKMKNGVSAVMMRDLVDSFIQEFQQRHHSEGREGEGNQLIPARGERYEIDVDRFLSQFGFVTWRRDTLLAMERVWPNLNAAQREKELYNRLREKKVLDGDGSAIAKKSTTYVQNCLREMGINDEQLHRLLLHDLGLVHRKDLEEMRGLLEDWVSSEGLRKEFKDRVQRSLDRIMKALVLVLDGFPQSEAYFKQKLELAILQGLVSPYEMKAYLKKHHIRLEKKQLLEQLTIFKLAFIESINKEQYHYLSLEEDLLAIESFMMKVFDNQEIDNDVYRIVSLKKEDLVIAGLTYVSGIGYISLSALDLVIRTIRIILEQQAGLLTIASGSTQTSAQVDELTRQITALTQLANGLNYGFSAILTGVGGIALLLNGYAMIKTLRELRNIKNGKKVYTLLEQHIQQIAKKDEDLRPEQSDVGDAILFHAMTQHYLKKLKKKSLLNSLKLNFIWSGLGALTMFNGITGLLILAGVTAAVGVGVAASFSSFIFFGVIIIPAMLLMIREIEMKEKLMFANDAIEALQKVLMHDDPELRSKKKLFLSMFFSNVKEAIGLAICKTEIQYYQNSIAKGGTFDKIDMDLVGLHRARRHALKYGRKIKSRSTKDEEDLTEAIEEELVRQNIQLEGDELKEMKPSTFRSGVDFLLESVYPGVTHNGCGHVLSGLGVPKYDGIYRYENDVVLSALFIHIYRIYRNVTSNMKEYSYLLHKKRYRCDIFMCPYPGMTVN